MADVFTGLTGTGTVTLSSGRNIPLIMASVTTLPSSVHAYPSDFQNRLFKAGWVAPCFPAGGDFTGHSGEIVCRPPIWIEFEHFYWLDDGIQIYADRVTYQFTPLVVVDLYVF